MTNRLPILVDINVILDVLAERKPHYEGSARVWSYVEANLIDGYLAAHTVTTLHYLLSKHLEAPQVTKALKRLIKVFKIAAVDQKVIKHALAMDWRDFEDAVQNAVALQIGAKCIVTRNPLDFEESTLDFTFR